MLIDKGFVDDRKTAEGWVMAGKVIADGKRIDKPGQMVDPDDEIVVKGIERKYASRGGLKIEGALDDFGLDVSGKVVIDAGASTGGFTDCLLQRGAAKVYAVDVGFGRLAGKMSADSRVVALEKVNISDPSLIRLDPRPTFATVDLSYLSLRKAIPILADILHGVGEMVCLVKPLYEVPDSNMRRTGKIEDPNVYRDLLIDLAAFAREQGYAMTGVTHSHVLGSKGAREFLIRVCLNPNAAGPTDQEIADQVARAVSAVMAMQLGSS